jgi:subtilisin
VTFQPGTPVAERAASARQAGASLRFNYNIVDAVAVMIPNSNALAALQRDPSVLEIIPDRPVHAIQAPNGNGNGKGKGNGEPGGTVSGQVVPEGVKRVGVPTASSNGAGVGVAVVDTGIDLAHADLAVGTSSFDAFGSSCQDDNGHGTHVSGTVAALDNTVDVVGVAPAATPYCVKVLDQNGSGSDSTVMAGLDWVATNANAVNPPIRVANMSLGREGTLNDNSALRASVQALKNMGVVVVVAAGNDSSKEVKEMVPAGYPEVIAVASASAIDGTNKGCRFFSGTIPADTASYFTTDGAFDPGTQIGVTVSAPGEDKEDVNKPCFAVSTGILSLKLGGGTTRMSGTSMASPHVAGVVARILNAGSYTADSSGVDNVRTTLRSTADRETIAPLDSPAGGYSFDGEREGIAQAP